MTSVDDFDLHWERFGETHPTNAECRRMLADETPLRADTAVALTPVLVSPRQGRVRLSATAVAPRGTAPVEDTGS